MILIDAPYAVLTGNGRSGTNWLLSILDASPITFCRNEPHLLTNSPFSQLPDALQIQMGAPSMDYAWDHFVSWATTRMGERDHRFGSPKNYIYPISYRLGAADYPFRPKLRRVLRYFFPEFRQSEWSIPWWIGHQRYLENAHPVLKLNDLRAWVVKWILENRLNVRVLHIMRHPEGQLNSAIKRFFGKLTPQQIEAETLLYRGVLKIAAAIDSKWGSRFGDIDRMSLVEAVIWFWRYNNEEICAAGLQKSNFKLIIYERMIEDPAHHSQEIYEFCNLPMTDNIRKRIEGQLGTSVWGTLPQSPRAISKAWMQELSRENKDVVAKVLSGSNLMMYWHN